jgi:preprotein translocase subunit SecY
MGGVSIYSKADVGLQEVEPYIPFNINPTGMQPVLTTTYLMAVPALVAKYEHPSTRNFFLNKKKKPIPSFKFTSNIFAIAIAHHRQMVLAASLVLEVFGTN